MKEDRCWFFHAWGRWTVANTKGTDTKTGVESLVGVQWRECKRCGRRQQELL